MRNLVRGKAFGFIQYAMLLYVGNLILAAVQRNNKKKAQEKDQKLKDSEKVDRASEDSFPASDPPAWGSSGSIAGPIH